MAVKIHEGAPYAPTTVVADLLTRNRNGGLPEPVTLVTLERLGVSESLRPRTLQTLKQLDYVSEDGSLTPDFANLRKVPTPDYLPKIAEMLRATYAEVFAVVDPSNATYEQIKDAFRVFTPPGQIDRMTSLFLGLLDHTKQWENLPTSRGNAATPSVPRKSTPGRSDGKQGRTRQTTPPPVVLPPPSPTSEFSQTVKLAGAAGTVALSADVNPIKLKGEARTFFYALVDMLDEYESKTSGSNVTG